MKRRVAATCLARPRASLAAALMLLAAAGAYGLPVTGILKSSVKDLQNPASQYERLNNTLGRAIGGRPELGLVALVSADRSNLPAAQARVVQLLAREGGFERALFSHGGSFRQLVSADGRESAVLAAFRTPEQSAAAAADIARKLAARGTPRLPGDARLRFGGSDMIYHELDTRTLEDISHAELIAFPIILLIAFAIFGGAIAAALPLVVAGAAIALAFALLRFVDQFTPVSIFALSVVSALGLGLGIDYSLFVLWRYREERRGGADDRAALAITLGSAGRTVLISSLTVASILATLLLFPLRFLNSMGIGGALVALADGAVALLLLPPLLLVLGDRIDALSPGWLRRRSRQMAGPDGGRIWRRFAKLVMRRPLLIAVASSLALLAAAVPVLHLQVTPPDSALLPAGSASRQVEDALATRFARNPASTIAILVHAPARAPALSAARAAGRSRGGREGGPAASGAAPQVPAEVLRLAAAARQSAGALADQLTPAPAGADTWLIELLPHGIGFSAADQRLVQRLRVIAAPYGALVGGISAYFVDEKAAIGDHAPLALSLVALLVLLFLFAMTESLVLPVKALLVSVLTVCVSTGTLVVVFQDGLLSGLLGFRPIGGLEEANLILMFALAFALSTDYGLFLYGRIKEAHASGMDNRQAVAHGMQRTGVLISAAALLFCVSIGAFVDSRLFYIKQFGVGAVVAVAVDATLVRALLVPALMALLGDWNWWAPKALRRGFSGHAVRAGRPEAIDARPAGPTGDA